MTSRDRIAAPFLLGVLLVIAASSAAQEQAATENPVTIQDLRTPYSPGFILLGVEPSNVERPTNPKALALSAFGAIQNGGNFAIEFAPYWLTSHPHLTFDDYYNASLLERVLQTFSVSAATALNLEPPEGSTASDETGAAISLRFSLFRGHPRQSDVDALRAISERMEEPGFALFRARSARSAAVEARKQALVRPGVTRAEIDTLDLDIARADAQVAKAEEELNRLVDEGEPLRKKIGGSGHLGFSLDVAGGAAGLFPSGNSEDGRFASGGIWLIPGYRMEDESLNLEILGVGRYLRSEELTEQDLFDFGGRLTAEIPQFLDTGDLALSVEGVGRIDASDSSNNTERIAGIIEYELPEVVRLGNAKYVTATFGQDFEDQTGDNRTIALFGLNFTFGADPKVAGP